MFFCIVTAYRIAVKPVKLVSGPGVSLALVCAAVATTANEDLCIAIVFLPGSVNKELATLRKN